MKAEAFYPVSDVKARFFPRRSLKWIKKTFKTGSYGPVMREADGWSVSESAIVEYQRQHVVNIVPIRKEQRSNLRQFAS